MDDVVAGIDWHKRGWVAVVLREPCVADVFVDTDLGGLVERLAEVVCIGVDMPIGLPDCERAADSLAREYVGPRWNSVFMTPPREVLEAESYFEANEIAPALTGGKKISQQAWALRHNIMRVEAVAAGNPRLIEIHPEVSFREMSGGAVAYPKSSWNGHSLRRRWLADAGIVLPDHLAEGGNVPIADILDAGAAAWTAKRYARGTACSFPANATPGQREVIWY